MLPCWEGKDILFSLSFSFFISGIPFWSIGRFYSLSLFLQQMGQRRFLRDLSRAYTLSSGAEKAEIVMEVGHCLLRHKVRHGKMEVKLGRDKGEEMMKEVETRENERPRERKRDRMRERNCFSRG